MAPGKFTQLFFLDEATALAAGHRPDAHTRQRRFHEAPIDDLPDRTFVLRGDQPHLVLGPRLLRWSPAGYAAHTNRPAGTRTTVITPPSLVALLGTDRTPLVPFLHPSATAPPAVRPPTARCDPQQRPDIVCGPWPTTGDCRLGCSSTAGRTP